MPLWWSTDPVEFTWEDNSVISWSNWGDGADDLDVDKCAVVDTDTLWYTRGCDKKYRFVCQTEETSDNRQPDGWRQEESK